MAERTVALVGLESVGKSALLRCLSGAQVPSEANVRGTTVACQRARLAGGDAILIDTPGLRVDADSDATRLALAALAGADRVLLVVRAATARAELDSVWSRVGSVVGGRPIAIAVTTTSARSTSTPSWSARRRRWSR